jgi:hypothetical protein
MALISEGTKTASKTIKNISNILTNRILERKKISNKILNYKNRRYENDVIVKKQNELFAVTSIRTSGGSKRLALSQVGGSFLSRILQFAGFVTSGWLLTNMPTWIAGAKELSNRITSLNSTFSGFVDNIWNMIYDIGRVSTALFENLKTFDLTDSSDRIRNSLIELTGTLDSMGDQIKEAFSVLTEPFMNVPPLGTEAGPGAYPDLEPQRPEQPTQPSGGGLPDPKSAEMYRIAAALTTEGRAGQSAVDIMQVVVNRKASGRYGSSYTDIFSRPNQFEGVTGKRSGAKFKQIQTLQDAVKWSGQSSATLLGIIRDLQNPSMQEEAAKHVKGALEFRAAPQYYLKNGLVRGEMGPDGRFYNSAWRGSSGDNQFLQQSGKDPMISGSASFNLPQPSSQKPQPPSQKSTPTSTPTRAISTGNMNLIPHTGSGGFIQGSSGFGKEDYEKYGVHFHLSPPNMSESGFLAAREVAFTAVKSMIDRGSTVYFSNIKKHIPKGASDSQIKSMILAEQKAHTKPGRTQGGIDIQEKNPNVGPTHKGLPGSKIAFPLAVGSVSSLSSRSGYGREAEVIGSGGVKLAHGASGSTSSQISSSTPTPSTPSTPLIPSSNSSVSQIPSEIEMQSSTTEGDLLQSILNNIKESSKRQDIILIDDLQDTSTQSTGNFVISGGISLDSQLNEKELLYSFLKNKLLLDLNYL